MDPLARLVDSHAVWVAEKDEREAIETACLEDFFGFGYGTEFFLEINPGLYEKMKDYLHTYVFDRRGAHVPEGENRWEYLTKKWKTDGLSDYGLPTCLLDYKSENNIKSPIKKLDKMDKKLDAMLKQLSD
jgi:hypothetical protein